MLFSELLNEGTIDERELIDRNTEPGRNFATKPYSFKEIQDRFTISKTEVASIKKDFESNGYKIESYPAENVFGEKYADAYNGAETKKGPLKDADVDMMTDYAIIGFDNGDDYFVYTSGANSYIRNWMFITDGISEDSTDEPSTNEKRRTTAENPLITIYSSEVGQKGPSMSGHMNLVVAMNIHGIEPKYQSDVVEELDQAKRDGEKWEVPLFYYQQRAIDGIKEGYFPVKYYFEYSEHHEKEMADNQK